MANPKEALPVSAEPIKVKVDESAANALLDKSEASIQGELDKLSSQTAPLEKELAAAVEQRRSWGVEINRITAAIKAIEGDVGDKLRAVKSAITQARDIRPDQRHRPNGSRGFGGV